MRGFAEPDERTGGRVNARMNAVSVSSPDVTFARSSPRRSPAATLPRDAYGRVVDVPRGTDTKRHVSPNGVSSSYVYSFASSSSSSSSPPPLVRPPRARRRLVASEATRVQGVARARLADADEIRSRVPGAVLSHRRAPAVYHSEMVEMVRRRERSDEVAEARRKVGLCANARGDWRRTAPSEPSANDDKSRRGQMIAGFHSEFEENRREGAVVGPNGDVVNLPRRPGPERDVARAARRAAAFEDDDEDRGSRVSGVVPGRARVLRPRHEDAKRAHRAPRRRRADVPDQQGVREDGGGGRWRRVRVLVGGKIREVPGVGISRNASRPVRAERRNFASSLASRRSFASCFLTSIPLSLARSSTAFCASVRSFLTFSGGISSVELIYTRSREIFSRGRPRGQGAQILLTRSPCL